MDPTSSQRLWCYTKHAENALQLLCFFLGQGIQPEIQNKFQKVPQSQATVSSWWFQPVSKICLSIWIISANRDEKKIWVDTLFLFWALKCGWSFAQCIWMIIGYPTCTQVLQLRFAWNQPSSPTWFLSTVFRTIDLIFDSFELIHEYISDFNIINPGRNPGIHK